MSLFMELVARYCHSTWQLVCVCVGGGGSVGNFSDDSEQCGTTQYLEYFACMHTHALPENALTVHGHMSILLHNYTQFQLAPRSSLGRNRTGGEGWVWRGRGGVTSL